MECRWSRRVGQGATVAVAAIGVLLSFSVSAQMLPGSASGQPLEVKADRAIEWREDQKAYVARGNAYAKKGDVVVTADLLTAYYRIAPNKGNEVFRMVAEGNVHVVRVNQEVFGDKGVYDVDQKLAVVTGRNLKLVTPTDIVTARDSLEYYEEKGLMVARGDALAIRDQKKLRADILVGRFVEQDGKQTLDRIDGEGHVVVTTPTDVAISDRLMYAQASNIAILVGQVKITRNDNQIVGDAAEMNMTTKVNRVLSSSGRVEALLVNREKAKEDAQPAAQKPAGQQPVNQRSVNRK
ncbi:lipopolysaccharide export system protein LptA [Azospirillaceae bacterium]